MTHVMKKLYLMILAAGLASFTACRKEVIPTEDSEESLTVTYIRASEESSEKTKASINGTDASFTWNTNDRIAVYADGYKISDPLSGTRSTRQDTDKR